VITLASDLYFLIAGKATTLAAVLLSVRHRASARDMGTNYRLFAHLQQSFSVSSVLKTPSLTWVIFSLQFVTACLGTGCSQASTHSTDL